MASPGGRVATVGCGTAISGGGAPFQLNHTTGLHSLLIVDSAIHVSANTY